MSRTVVVSGVGPGLGSSVAREFASHGADVVLLARSADYLERTAESITDSEPGTALAVPTDITDSNAVTAAFERTHDRFGRVDALVNNATISGGRGGGLLSVTEDDLAGAWDVRVAGGSGVRKPPPRTWAEGDGGTIIFTTSQTAIAPSENVAYAAARYAVRGIAKSMAATLGDRGIQTVHAVVDGWIANPDLRERYPDHDRWMDPDDIAVTYRRLVDHPDTVHTGELDLRHPRDDLSF